MMGYGGNWGMMGEGNVLGFLIWLVIFADFILLGVWLWKQINK